MNSGLRLVKSENFGAVKCDFYSNGEDVLMTREQIGTALEYSDPMVAIGKIHDRHEERLKKFSFTTLVNGRNTYLYITKGVMEICRWSQQPKADAFMDWVWDVVESIRKTGTYIAPQVDSKMLYQIAQALEEKERQIEQLTPKALFADALTTSKDSVLVNELAKIIKQNGVDIGQNRLFGWLRQNGYLCKTGENYNLPTQRAMDLELFEIKIATVTTSDGTTLVTRTPKVTGKGKLYFVNKFLSKERVI